MILVARSISGEYNDERRWHDKREIHSPQVPLDLCSHSIRTPSPTPGLQPLLLLDLSIRNSSNPLLFHRLIQPVPSTSNSDQDAVLWADQHRSVEANRTSNRRANLSQEERDEINRTRRQSYAAANAPDELSDRMQRINQTKCHMRMSYSDLNR